MALWSVGSKSRYFAFGVVALATLFIALWVGLGNGLHKNYETPTPVSIPIYSPLHLIAGIIWLVLVLDWFCIRQGTPGWGICLALDRFVCLGDIEHPAVYLGQRSLVRSP